MKQKYIMLEPVVENNEEEEEKNVFTTEEILEMEVSDANYLEEATYILSAMTGKRILDYVEEATGVRMPYSDKSKKTLITRGSEILAKYLETQDNE